MPVRKTVGKAKTTEENVPAEAPAKPAPSEGKSLISKKMCVFCQTNTLPTYTNTQALRKFVSDRAKIVPRARTGTCNKHQRAVSKQVKYARHLSLMPFVARV